MSATTEKPDVSAVLRQRVDIANKRIETLQASIEILKDTVAKQDEQIELLKRIRSEERSLLAGALHRLGGAE